MDDHALFRSGLSALVNGEPDMEVVAEVASGEEAVLAADRLNPDLILMDIHMPGMSGIEATRQIKASHADTKVVVLTATEADDLLFEAIRAGAEAYLVKTLEPSRFLAEVRAHLSGEASISGDMALKIIRAFDRREPEPTVSPLTQRELEVLKLVGEGATNRDIAQQLFISENTVKNHLRNILQKLHFANRVQAAAYAIRQGLVDKR